MYALPCARVTLVTQCEDCPEVRFIHRKRAALEGFSREYLALISEAPLCQYTSVPIYRRLIAYLVSTWAVTHCVKTVTCSSVSISTSRTQIMLAAGINV